MPARPAFIFADTVTLIWIHADSRFPAADNGKGSQGKGRRQAASGSPVPGNAGGNRVFTVRRPSLCSKIVIVVTAKNVVIVIMAVNNGQIVEVGSIPGCYGRHRHDPLIPISAEARVLSPSSPQVKRSASRRGGKGSNDEVHIPRFQTMDAVQTLAAVRTGGPWEGMAEGGCRDRALGLELKPLGINRDIRLRQVKRALYDDSFRIDFQILDICCPVVIRVQMIWMFGLEDHDLPCNPDVLRRTAAVVEIFFGVAP